MINIPAMGIAVVSTKEWKKRFFFEKGDTSIGPLLKDTQPGGFYLVTIIKHIAIGFGLGVLVLSKSAGVTIQRAPAEGAVQ